MNKFPKDGQGWLIAVAAFVLLAIGGGVLAWKIYQERRGDVVYEAQIALITKASGIDKISDFHGKLDRLRGFINANSQHKEDDEFFSLWRDRVAHTESFIDHLQGRRADLPHMECSTRANMMMEVLKAQGFRVRSIDVYHPSVQNNLSGHALFDVFNPETKRWESQDPEYDVYWKNVQTGQRASMVEGAVYLEIVQPCRDDVCGWGLKSREGAESAALRDLTAYVTPIDRAEDERITFYRPDIGADKVLNYDDKTGPYCTVLEKNCRDGFMPATPENLARVMD